MYFLSKRKKNKGFTLIELLVVISIISLLSSIVFASLNSARSKARDSKRRSELRQILTSMELYYDKYGNYNVFDPNANRYTGYSVGEGWFSLGGQSGNYVVAIGQGLVDTGFLSSNPHDPGGQDTGTVAGKTGYMLYPCQNGFYAYAGLENPTAADTTLYNAGITCVGTSLSSYGMNYAVGHN